MTTVDGEFGLQTKGAAVDTAAAAWRKSSRSGPWTDNCVEVALLDGGVGLRDTKDNGAGPVLVFDAGEWGAFLRGAADGEFTLS